jgi:hypothetical protein
MANCSGFLFNQIFSHVKAHLDDNKKYSDLSRDAQLNCQMDYLAKSAIYEVPHTQHEQTKCFPLEPLCVLLGPNKVTLDKGDQLWFWVHKQLACLTLHQTKTLLSHQIDWIDWEMVHTALCRVPQMFQIWACKQVRDIAPANGNRPWE